MLARCRVREARTVPVLIGVTWRRERVFIDLGSRLASSETGAGRERTLLAEWAVRVRSLGEKVVYERLN